MTANVVKKIGAPSIEMTVINRDGGKHNFVVSAGENLMEALRGNGMDVAAICGGCCSCGTCHVYLEAPDNRDIPGPKSDEAEMLEMQTECRASSRLSCQIQITEALDGVEIHIAPEF